MRAPPKRLFADLHATEILRTLRTASRRFRGHGCPRSVSEQGQPCVIRCCYIPKTEGDGAESRRPRSSSGGARPTSQNALLEVSGPQPGTTPSEGRTQVPGKSLPVGRRLPYRQRVPLARQKLPAQDRSADQQCTEHPHPHYRRPGHLRGSDLSPIASRTQLRQAGLRSARSDHRSPWPPSHRR